MRKNQFIKVSLITAGLLLGSTGVSNADSTPAPTTTTTATAAEIAAYKLAMVQYQVAMAQYHIAYRAVMEKYQADWKAVREKYEAAWKLSIEQYRAARQVRDLKIEPIITTFRAAVTKANSDFTVAISAATTPEQKTAALTARNTAIKAATTVRDSAITAIGVAPVKPVRPAELVKPAAPIKPVAPVKPVKPAGMKSEVKSTT